MNPVHQQLSLIGTQNLNSFAVLARDMLNGFERLVELTLSASREALDDAAVQTHNLGTAGSPWAPLSSPNLSVASLEKASTYFKRCCTIVADSQGRFIATMQARLAELNDHSSDIAAASLGQFSNLTECISPAEPATQAPARSRKAS